MRTLSTIGRVAACAIAAAGLLAGCASEPPQEIARAPELLVCPPVEKPVCPPAAPLPTPAPPPPPVEYRGKLQPASWLDLPAWGRESLRDSLEAFVRGCQALEKQDAWKAVCAGAHVMLPGSSERDIAAFFELNFEPYQVVNPDDTTTGMVTGYYEPLLHGSRVRTQRYRYPIYRVPRDLLVVDLTEVFPELKGKRLRGRLEGNRVVPYLSRGEIDREGTPLKGNELVWVDDPVDVFFLHIQGSGQVELESG